MDAEMEHDHVGTGIYVVPPAMIGEMSPLKSPESGARKDLQPHEARDKERTGERVIKQEIVGAEEPSIQHLGWFIAAVALMLILINIFSIILH